MAHRPVSSPAPSRRALLAGICATASAAAVGGCSVLSEPAPTLYVLTPKSTFDQVLPQVSWQLVVEEPFAAAGLDTARIAVAPDATRLDYFGDVAWTDYAPAMVQTLMVESFENSERIVAVGRDNIDLRADFILKTELREFQAQLTEDDQPPRVLIQINAKLVNMPQRTIIANETFRSQGQAATNDIPAVIVAFDDALGSVLKDLITWTLATPSAVVVGAG